MADFRLLARLIYLHHTAWMATTVKHDSSAAGWHACADWYHALFTGSLLAAITHCGQDAAAELVYRVFSTQRQRRFLPGLVKLGLTQLPHAVAAAQYHYLSNHIGGVSVEYIYESDRKAWVRYPAPRWVWAGTALCAIPSQVSLAMLRGWHAQNGVSLNNPRLGFVYTKQTADGDSSLEGYYYEYDYELAPAQRLRHAPQEHGPPFNAEAAPVLASAQWSATRLAKAKRNYAMEYVRTLLPIAVDYFGPDRAVDVFQVAARKVAMQFYHQTALALGLPAYSTAQAYTVAQFGNFVIALAAAQDDVVVVASDADSLRLTQTGLKVFDDIADLHPAVLHCWNGLIEGALAACNSRLNLQTQFDYSSRPTKIEWQIDSL